MKYYFAYGSNMDKSRLSQRVKRDVLGEKALLKGHKLFFSLDNTMTDPYADIRISKGDQVYGVLYSLTDGEIKILDTYEGVGVEGDESYRKEIVKVESSNETNEAVVYIMTTERNFAQPKNDYLEHLLRGMRDNRFSEEIIENIIQTSNGF
jgi:gamma-glutamylcyclotransferase